MLFNTEWEKNNTKVEPWRGILAGAALVVEKGWCKYELESDDGSNHCMLGAMQIAYYGKIIKIERMENHAWDFLVALERLQNNIHMEPWTWNDTMGRTKEEVVNKLIEVSNAVG